MSNISSPKGRVKGSNITAPIRPSVSLLSSTANPVGTLFSLWHGSRHPESVTAEDAQLLYKYGTGSELLAVLNPKFSGEWAGADAQSEFKRLIEVEQYILSCYPEHQDKGVSHAIKQIAKMNLIANVPSAEAVQFTFSIDNASVALREQMVRSKLASYWTQTSRTSDLTTMDINMSDRIGFYGGNEAEEVYKDTVKSVRDAYVKLRELGVPVEEIRLSPESRVHRVYWMISARALLPILSKRVSWIAQATLWSPIVSDVANILREVDPMFADFFGECEGVEISEGEVTFYKYDNEVEDRYYEKDYQPVDPLWLARHGVTMPEHTDTRFYDDMKKSYIPLWNDEILGVLGWDRNNPKKLGKYDRPESYWKENGQLEVIQGLKTKYSPK